MLEALFYPLTLIVLSGSSSSSASYVTEHGPTTFFYTDEAVIFVFISYLRFSVAISSVLQLWGRRIELY